METKTRKAISVTNATWGEIKVTAMLRCESIGDYLVGLHEATKGMKLGYEGSSYRGIVDGIDTKVLTYKEIKKPSIISTLGVGRDKKEVIGKVDNIVKGESSDKTWFHPMPKGGKK